MRVSELYEIYKQHPVITTDTRNGVAGSIFFALKGEKFDGNDYIEQALEQGCAYAVGDNLNLQKNNRRIIPVEDVLQTLQELARFHRRTLQIPVIGITGTNGKTTTKELIAAVLSAKYNVLYTQGNLNNHIGVPLTLLSMTKSHEIAVIEMGANHPGEITELAAIAEPDYGLITNVGKAHLEGFGSFENVVETKSELYRFLDGTGGKIFINQDNPYLNAIPVHAEKIYYGTQPGVLVRGEVVESDSPFLALKWFAGRQSYEVKTQLIGSYNLENVLAAVTVGTYFEVEAGKTCEALTNYSPQNNRSQLLKTSRNRLVVDAYNANPTSMLSSLGNFSRMKVSPKAVILGDMKELGMESIPEHQKILDLVNKASFDKVFLCGEIFSGLSGNEYPSFTQVAQLIEHLKKEKLEGYYILIKGSRSVQLEKVINYL